MKTSLRQERNRQSYRAMIAMGSAPPYDTLDVKVKFISQLFIDGHVQEVLPADFKTEVWLGDRYHLF